MFLFKIYDILYCGGKLCGIFLLFYMCFWFWLGVVNLIVLEEFFVDGNVWIILSYGNGFGYDWGFWKDFNIVDISKLLVIILVS